MREIVIMIILNLSILNGFSQENIIPNNIEEAIRILSKECNDSLKDIIKSTADKELPYNFWDGRHNYFIKWTDENNKNLGIKKYLEGKGILTSLNQEIVILVSFKQSLLGKKISESEILYPYQILEKKIAEENKVRFTADSLAGVYIPKDLEDCFNQINSIWSDSTRSEVVKYSEGKFIGLTHMGIGLWMRNNWQLWAGSRLSKYFNSKGVTHPDDMTGIILTSYYRYLTGKKINLDEQLKEYRSFNKNNRSLKK